MTQCPHCNGDHTLSQCPTWRVKAAEQALIDAALNLAGESTADAALLPISNTTPELVVGFGEFGGLARLVGYRTPPGFRLLPVALAPHIKDAIVASGHFMPESLWSAIIAAQDLVEPAAQSQASAAPTDAQCKLASDLANVETDAWADGLSVEPTSEQIDGFLVRALLRHLGMASAAPVLTDAALGPIPWAAVNQAIKAVGDEARERGKMFPQTSDEQQDDRAAVKRVMGMIEWYATNGGAVAERLPDWPHAIQSGDTERLDFLDTNKRFRMGWNVGAAPAGNLSIQSIITGGKPIREAIDAARHLAATPAKREGM